MTTALKDTHRIGADVYVRAPDDATIQFKASNFKVDFEKQEADIGMYPRRWGTFSMLHLPDAYRVTVPLAELSLTPLPGAQQMGFEEYLVSQGEVPPPWMDNAGHMHAVGCEEPAAEAHQADEDADGAPVFSTATVELPFTATSDDAPKNVAIGAGALVEAPVKPAKKTRTSVTAPLFAKDEILKKYAEVKDALEKLGKMLEASL